MWLKLLFLFSLGCTKAWTTSIDLGGVLSGNRMAAVPLGRTVRSGIVDIEGICAKAGVACQNCTHAVTCVQLPGGWLKIPLLACAEGTTCNAHLGQCSNESVPECNARSHSFHHTCEQVGIFPDAYDCRKFHLCSPPEGLPDGQPADRRTALCPRHYGYDPQTAQCSIKLEDGQCSQPPTPDCEEVGQTGILAGSANHYYVCLHHNDGLFPQIFVCPNGWYYLDGYCHSELTETSTTPKTEVPSTEKSTTTTTELFFSTERTSTYAADTFLADKFDLTNYEQIPATDEQQNEFENSFESHEFF